MKKTISGIRGIYGSDLTLDHIKQYCTTFCTMIPKNNCVVGLDTRPSGRDIHDVVCSTLSNMGIAVYDLGMVPTPVVFRESRKFGAGIMITSSHNPISWNGLKFILEGRGINSTELDVLLNDTNKTSTFVGNIQSIHSDYVNQVIDLVGHVENKCKVVIDIGGGAARYVAPELFKKINCDVSVINETIETSSRGPDPTTDKLTDLLNHSKTHDIGFAFDLDADRLIVAKDGKKLSPDMTLGLGVSKSLQLGNKKFVLSLDTSISIEKFLVDNGATVWRSPVGEANVVDSILKHGAQSGGEGSSAGFILSSFNNCRDGLLTAGLITSIIDTSTFNDIVSTMENYHQIRTKINVDSNLHDTVLSAISEDLSSASSEIITIDGVKAIFDEDSWVLVRPSNTEDAIRISCESTSLEKVSSIANETENLVNKYVEQY